jgi:K+ transporter
VRETPTAPVAAGTLIVAYAVAVSTGSRPLGGVVLAIGGLWCIWAWQRRCGRRTATILGCVGFGAFVASHVLALAIGAWPSVLAVAAVVAAVTWVRADSRRFDGAAGESGPPRRFVRPAERRSA